MGTIRLWYGLDTIRGQNHMAWMVYGALMCSLLLVMLLALHGMLGRSIIRPIDRLRQAMLGEADPQKERALVANGHDEVADLTRAFCMREERATLIDLRHEIVERSNAEEHAPIAEDGLHRPIGRRRRPRFQQHAAGILGAADIIGQHLPSASATRPPAHHHLGRGESRRSDPETAGLLAQGQVQSTRIDVHAIIDDTLQLPRRSIDDASRSTPNTKPAGQVIGDPTQLENALLNLGVNARDAMPQGGELVYATATRQLDTADEALELQAGDYLVIQVRDNGSGIAEDVPASSSPSSPPRKVRYRPRPGRSLRHGGTPRSDHRPQRNNSRHHLRDPAVDRRKRR